MRDGMDVTSVPGAVAGSDQLTNIVLSGGKTYAANNFGERGLHAAYISIRMFLASTPAPDDYLRDLLARGEDLAGNTALAAAIRAGKTDMEGSDNVAPLAVGDSYEAVQERRADGRQGHRRAGQRRRSRRRHADRGRRRQARPRDPDAQRRRLVHLHAHHGLHRQPTRSPTRPATERSTRTPSRSTSR